MGDVSINLGFDAASLERLSRLTEFDMMLALFFGEAMATSLDELEAASQAMMAAGFKNPTGVLETAFRKRVSNPFRAILGNYLPYAQRRNYGFSGMTDSLGRFYPHDPGIEWAEGAVEMATPYVEEIFRKAVLDAIAEVTP